MHVSVHSYSFHPMIRAGTMDVFGSLETVRYRYGLRAADIWDLSLASLDPAYVQAVRRGLIERELELVGLNVSSYWLWDDDPGTRDYNHHRVPSYLQIAEVLGAQTVCIDAGGHHSAVVYTDEEFDYIVAHYRHYAQRAYDGGYRIGPENHFGPELVPRELRRLCEAVDHPGFGLLLHTGRWQGEDADQGEALMAPWAMQIHLPHSLTDTELVEAMTTLRDHGYAGAWGVEVLYGGTYATVGTMIARVQRVLESWRLADV